MSNIKFEEFSKAELEALQERVKQEILSRTEGPKRVIYEVKDWGEYQYFSDIRCALICMRDQVEQFVSDIQSDGGLQSINKNCGSFLHGFRPIEITAADFKARCSGSQSKIHRLAIIPFFGSD